MFEPKVDSSKVGFINERFNPSADGDYLCWYGRGNPSIGGHQKPGEEATKNDLNCLRPGFEK